MKSRLIKISLISLLITLVPAPVRAADQGGQSVFGLIASLAAVGVGHWLTKPPRAATAGPGEIARSEASRLKAELFDKMCWWALSGQDICPLMMDKGIALSPADLELAVAKYSAGELNSLLWAARHPDIRQRSRHPLDEATRLAITESTRAQREKERKDRIALYNSMQKGRDDRVVAVCVDLRYPKGVGQLIADYHWTDR